MSDQVTGLLAACGLSLLLTPLFAALARRLGVVDRSGACDRPVVIGGIQRPVAATAVEESAGIPLLGGVAVWTAVAVAMAAITPARERGVVGVIVGLGAAMCAIGVWDDHARLRAWTKLGATFVAAGALVGMGRPRELAAARLAGLGAVVTLDSDDHSRAQPARQQRWRCPWGGGDRRARFRCPVVGAGG